MRNRKTIPAALLVTALALVAAGCGGGGDGSTGGGDGYGYGSRGTTTDQDTTATTAAGSSAPAVVSVGTVPKLGKVIVDGNGLTLYDFHKDKGTTSTCYGECAAVWPPLLTEGEPTGQAGISASKLGTTTRKDGTEQVTFAGHPLYTYVADKQPGEGNGNDFSNFGAEWYALTPSGAEPED